MFISDSLCSLQWVAFYGIHPIPLLITTLQRSFVLFCGGSDFIYPTPFHTLVGERLRRPFPTPTKTPPSLYALVLRLTRGLSNVLATSPNVCYRWYHWFTVVLSLISHETSTECFSFVNGIFRKVTITSLPAKTQCVTLGGYPVYSCYWC